MFRLPYDDIPKGTIFEVNTRKPSAIFLARERGDKSGWSNDSLEKDEWEQCNSSVAVSLFGHESTDYRTELVHLDLWRKIPNSFKRCHLPEVDIDASVAAIFVVESKMMKNLFLGFTIQQEYL